MLWCCIAQASYLTKPWAPASTETECSIDGSARAQPATITFPSDEAVLVRRPPADNWRRRQMPQSHQLGLRQFAASVTSLLPSTCAPRADQRALHGVYTIKVPGHRNVGYSTRADLLITISRAGRRGVSHGRLDRWSHSWHGPSSRVIVTGSRTC